MIPKILHMVWVGNEEPPDYFWDNLNKWKSLMPDWEYMIWTNDKLTEDYFDCDYLDLLSKTRNGAQAADLLKWYILWKWGGHYLDADVTPLRSLDRLYDFKQSVLLCHDLNVTWDYIACGYAGSEKNHILFHNLVNHMYKVDLNDKNQQLTTGPGALGKCWYSLINEKYHNIYLLPYWMFYRNMVGDPDIEIPNRVMRNHPDALGNHFYAASWK